MYRLEHVAETDPQNLNSNVHAMQRRLDVLAVQRVAAYFLEVRIR
jgi:hypothetical protein